MQHTTKEMQEASEAARADVHDPDKVVALAETDGEDDRIDQPIWHSYLRR